MSHIFKHFSLKFYCNFPHKSLFHVFSSLFARISVAFFSFSLTCKQCQCRHIFTVYLWLFHKALARFVSYSSFFLSCLMYPHIHNSNDARRKKHEPHRLSFSTWLSFSIPFSAHHHVGILSLCHCFFPLIIMIKCYCTVSVSYLTVLRVTETLINDSRNVWLFRFIRLWLLLLIDNFVVVVYPYSFAFACRYINS